MAISKLTGQFADKPTRGGSIRGLVNSPTAQFLKSQKDITYMYAKQKPNTNPNPVNY